ncbi:hypothetical protein KM043_003343 [Ampulex compressa]|nr:hypothetical protein KM043_003343 [Ampulex compressa]
MPVGSTWAGSGLNIDLDNIMGGKTKQSGPAPTMNQLASNSPQHQSKPMGPPAAAAYASPVIPAQQQSQQQVNPAFFPAFQTGAFGVRQIEGTVTETSGSSLISAMEIHPRFLSLHNAIQQL